MRIKLPEILPRCFGTVPESPAAAARSGGTLQPREGLLLALVFLFYLVNFALIRSRLIHFSTETVSMLSYNWIPEATEALRSGQWGEWWRVANSMDYPPLFVLTGSLLSALFGKSWLLITLFNHAFYLALFLVFCVLTGKELRDRETGVIAALLTAAYPLTYMIFNTVYPMDFAIMGLLMMAFYFLLRSDFFRITSWSIAFAAACGWGMMMKDPFGAFLGGAVMAGCWRAVRAAFHRQYRPLLNILLSAAVLGAMTAPYYINYVRWISMRLVHEATGLPWYDYANLQFVTTGLWERQLSLPFLLLVIPGLYWFSKTARTEVKVSFLGWILIPNLIILLMPHWKTSRYLLPQLPVLALVSAVGWRHIAVRRVSRWLFPALICLGVYQYYDIVYDLGPLSRLKIGKFHYYRGIVNDDAQNFAMMQRQSEELVNMRSCLRETVAELDRAGGRPRRRFMLFMPPLADNDVYYAFNLQTLCWFSDINLEALSFYRDTALFGRLPEADIVAVVADRGEPLDLHSDTYAETILVKRAAELPADYAGRWQKVLSRLGPARQVRLSDDRTMHVFVRLSFNERRESGR